MYVYICKLVYSISVMFQAKVRARLSRPLQRGRGKHVSRGDYRYGRPPVRSSRGPWSHPVPRSIPLRGTRYVPSRVPPVMDRGFKRTVGVRDRRPVMSIPPRARPVAPPHRSYDRRPPGICLCFLIILQFLCNCHTHH